MAETAQQRSGSREKRLARTAVDPQLVLTLAGFEASLCLRGRDGPRLLAWSVTFVALLALLPLLWRMRHPGAGDLVTPGWLRGIAFVLQFCLFTGTLTWTRRRLRRELFADRLAELLVTRASLRDIALGKALAAAGVAAGLVLAELPVLVLLGALGGRGTGAVLAVTLTLLPAALLGVALGTEAVLTGVGAAAMRASTLLWCLVLLATWLGTWDRSGWLRLALHAVNPLSAIAGAWDPERTLWARQCAALWLVALGAGLWNSRRLGHELPQAARPPRKLPEFHFFDFDPRAFRRWRIGMTRVEDLTGGLPADLLPPSVIPNRPGPDLRRSNPVAAFDRVFGSRLFLRRDWQMLLLIVLQSGWVLALVLALRESPASGGVAAAFTMAFQGLLLSCRAAYGMAASIAADREKRRWPFLLLTPLTAWQILAGKAQAVLQDDLVLVLSGVAACLALIALGALTPALAAILLGLGLLLPIAAAGIGAFLALRSASQSEALFRVTLVLLGPPVAVAFLATFDLTDPIYHLFSPLTAAPGAAVAGDASWARVAAGALTLYLVAGGLGALHVAGALRATLGALAGDR